MSFHTTIGLLWQGIALAQPQALLKWSALAFSVFHLGIGMWLLLKEPRT